MPVSVQEYNMIKKYLQITVINLKNQEALEAAKHDLVK
jgi:hypothetical protein